MNLSFFLCLTLFAVNSSRCLSKLLLAKSFSSSLRDTSFFPHAVINPGDQRVPVADWGPRVHQGFSCLLNTNFERDMLENGQKISYRHIEKNTLKCSLSSTFLMFFLWNYAFYEIIFKDILCQQYHHIFCFKKKYENFSNFPEN